jgi:hypothetical protein
MYAVGMHVPLFSADLLLILICVQIAGSSLSSHSSHALHDSKGLEAIDCSHETSHQPTTDATTAPHQPYGELFASFQSKRHCTACPNPHRTREAMERKQDKVVQ